MSVVEIDYEYQECTRKKRFTRKRDAVRKALGLRKLEGNERIDAYMCRFCAGWHVGHRPWWKR